MRSVLFFTLVFSVASVFGQQPFVRHPDNLRKAVPHHFNHDQKNAYRSVDKIARGHKVGPRQAPLRPQQTVPWLQWVQEGRWAAQADRNSEMLKVRAKLLEEKLKPNQFIFKPQINPQLKPKLNKKENGRIKREIEESRRKSNKEIKVNENPRHKRDVIMSQHIPKVVMPSEDQFEGRIKETEKRHKRQIVYFINRPPQLLARSPRTTPNPFIRDTHIDDYDIIRPEVGEREGMIPTVESGSSDPGSYPLVSETSDLEYESGYTISMSDSEDWHNYPLTTPSGPNPGWRLSTLADIYQKQRRGRPQILTPERTNNVNKYLRISVGIDQNLVRAKRSPKERKRKIGAYKEKIKQRRKIKDMKRKRRIIRNSKEDKAVKEDLKDEKAIERLLQRPRVLQRQTAYQEEESKEILWTNGTHNIVEDKESTLKWINDTHYVIYKEKDNSTDDWFHQEHILCYNEEWENMTSEEKRNATIGVQDETKEEEVKVKETDKTKAGGKGEKKKTEKRKKVKKGTDKKNKKKPKKAKKIMTVKNVNEAPKDPRKDMKEWKTKTSPISSEESEQKKKKKVKTSEEDISKSKEKKKKSKKYSVEDSDVSVKKKKRKKDKTDNLDENRSLIEKNKKKKKEKTDRRNSGETDSKKKSKTEKDIKKKKKKVDKSSESSKAEQTKKKKKIRKKDEDSSEKNKETRKKRSIYRTDESKTAEVRWEKIQKSEYDDGWTVIGGDDDKTQIYDTSYELIETRNITKKQR